MPIYKIHDYSSSTSPESVSFGRGRTAAATSSSIAWNDDLGHEQLQASVRGGGGMTFAELPEADREQDRRNGGGRVEVLSSSSSSYYNMDLPAKAKAKGPPSGKPETIIEREIRVQNEREAEWSAMHALRRGGGSEAAVEVEEPPSTATKNSTEITVSLYPSINLSTYPHQVEAPSGGGEAEGGSFREPPAEKPKEKEKERFVTQTYTRTSQGRIINEMADQQRREEELKQRRRDLGVELPGDAATAVEELGSSGLEDHHHQRQNYYFEASHHQTEEDRKKDVPDGQAFSSSINHDPHRGSTAAAASASVKPVSMKPGHRDHGLPRVPSQSRVQPFEDFEMIQFENQQFTPTYGTETPIEREKRFYMEREEELRRSRGLPPTNVNHQDVEVEVEVKARGGQSAAGGTAASGFGGPDQQQQQHPVDPEVSRKKYAENVLRREMQENHEREMALLSQGKIQSLSEQRIADEVRHVEKVSPETEELREFSRSRSVQREASYERYSQESPKMMMTTQEPPKMMMTTTTTVIADNRNNDRDSLSSGVTVTVKQTPSSLGGAGGGGGPGGSVVVKPPLVRSSYSHNMSVDESETEMKQLARSTAEKRIEEEVAEAKRREKELKEMRKSLRLDAIPEDSNQSAAEKGVQPDRSEAATTYDRGRVVDLGFGSSSNTVSISLYSSADRNGTIATNDSLDGSSPGTGAGDGPGRLPLIDEWERKIIDNAN